MDKLGRNMKNRMELPNADSTLKASQLNHVSQVWETESDFRNALSKSSVVEPYVSVIVPVYFGEDTIAKCVQSIIRQKCGRMELLVVDDGSKDKSVDVVNGILASSTPPSRVVVHQTNLGIANTLNQAVRAAEGDYVLIVHQDSELLGDNYLARAVKSLSGQDDVAIVCGTPIFPITEFNIYQKIFMIMSDHNHSCSPIELEEVSFAEHKCDLFKRQPLLQVGGFDSEHFRSSAEDQVVSWRLRNRGYKIIRDHRLKYIQRYGASLSTLQDIVKKLFKYGETQAGVMWLTRGTVLTKRHKTLDQIRRAKNRLAAMICSTIVLSGLVLSTFLSLYFLIPVIGTILIRTFHIARRARMQELKINNRTLPIVGFLGFCTDVAYFAGFGSGLISSLIGRKFQSRPKVL